MKAVDFANYTAIPTPAEVGCWLMQGYTRAIVGVSFGSVAKAQLQVCAAGGMEIEAFAWLRFNSDWRSPIDRALTVIQGLPVTRLWIDCEDATTWPEQAIEARIVEAERHIAQRAAVNARAIYTGAWWWNRYMPTCRTFASWDLWTASYTANPEVPPQGQPPLYGGWTKAAMWQYAGSVLTCGLNTDRNTILEVAAPPQEEDDMHVVVCYDTPNGLQNWALGSGNPRLIGSATEVKEAEALFGKARPISWALLKTLGAT